MENIFKKEFIESLSKDDLLALRSICNEYNVFIDNYSYAIEKSVEVFFGEHSEEYMDALAFIEAFFESRNMPLFGVDMNQPPQNIAKVFHHQLRNLCNDVQSQIRQINFLKDKENYRLSLESGFYYEFSEGDVDAIKKSIKELKEKIEVCDKLSEDHKARVLKKLNDLDSEINIKMTTLDKAYVLISEASILIYKLEKEAKPYVQIIKKIINLIWRAEARAEGLPSDTYLSLPDETTIEDMECKDENNK